METEEVEKLWNKGRISFWAVVQHYINNSDTDSILNSLRKLETDYIIPRSAYTYTYKRLSEIAFQHLDTRLSDYLKSNRGIDNDIKKSDLVYHNYFKTVDIFSINRYIAKKAKKESESIRDILLMSSEEFEVNLEQMEQSEREIICFIVGLGDYPDLIEVAMKRNSTSTLLGMAEAGKDIAQYFDDPDTKPPLTLVSNIYERLLLNMHEDLFVSFRQHIEEKYIPGERIHLDDSSLTKAGHKAILDHGSRNLQATVLEREDSLVNVETIVVYNEMFNAKYQLLIKLVKPFRERLPDNILEEMKKLPESLRYEVYGLTMDESFFTRNPSTAVKKTKIVSELKSYAKQKELPSDLSTSMTQLGLTKSDLRKVLPRNQSLKDETQWLYVFLIAVLLLLLFAGYMYYKPEIIVITGKRPVGKKRRMRVL